MQCQQTENDFKQLDGRRESTKTLATAKEEEEEEEEEISTFCKNQENSLRFCEK